MSRYGSSWEDRAREAAKPQMANVAKAKRTLSKLDKTALEAVAEAAITLLDEMSDPDEDHCLAGDDGCGRYWSGERGGWFWGSEWEGAADLCHAPEYGTDQREIMGRFGVAYRVE